MSNCMVASHRTDMTEPLHDTACNHIHDHVDHYIHLGGASRGHANAITKAMRD